MEPEKPTETPDPSGPSDGDSHATRDSIAANKAVSLSSVPAEAVTPGAAPQYATKKPNAIHSVEIHQGQPLDLQVLITSMDKLLSLMEQRRVNYSEHKHVNTTALLAKALNAVEALQSHLGVVVKSNISLDMADVALRFASWRSLMWIIKILIRSMTVQTEDLPLTPESESTLKALGRKISMATFATNMKSLIEDTETLNSAFPFIISITFHSDVIKSEEIEKQIQVSYVPPFWYGFKEETSNFRALINLLKTTVGGSMSQKNFVSKMFTMGTRAVDGILTTFQSAKEQTKKSHDIVKREASIEMLTKMWNLAESGVPSLVVSIATKPSIKVAKTIHISVPLKDRAAVGADAVECLLLSARSLPFNVPKGGVLNADGNLTPLTRDVPAKSKDDLQPSSPLAPATESSTTPQDGDAWRGDELVIHFHGGGFVSGSPYTHEMYLRHWVNGNPSSLLVSVNYTKAPGAIYPQAVNECFFAYKVLVEVGFLGFRPRKVILAGDSAGGNLVLAVTIRAIQEGLRVPDALLVAYPATDLRRSITLSRFLFGHDVLLPYDLIVLALEAYAPADKCDASKDPLVSPILAPDEILAKFPNKMLFMSASLDPLLDDCSAFLQRLRAVHKNPRWILLDLPHGFWNMAAVLPSARLSVTMGTEFIASVVSDQ